MRASEATAVVTPVVREKPSAGRNPKINPMTAAPRRAKKKGQPSSFATRAAK
jgi:hypothetical protein